MSSADHSYWILLPKTFDYDMPGRIIIEGYGRINGLPSLDYGTTADFNCIKSPEYEIQASSMWLSGSGGPFSGNGWPAAMYGDPYQYADGSSDPGSNRGVDQRKYGVQIGTKSSTHSLVRMTTPTHSLSFEIESTLPSG